MSRAHVLIVRRAKLYYTASGIIRPIGGRPVHRTATYRSDDTSWMILINKYIEMHGQQNTKKNCMYYVLSYLIILLYKRNKIKT